VLPPSLFSARWCPVAEELNGSNIALVGFAAFGACVDDFAAVILVCQWPSGQMNAVVACIFGANDRESVVPRSSRAVTCQPKQQFPVVNVIQSTSLQSSRPSYNSPSFYLRLYVIPKQQLYLDSFLVTKV
jgi:hypothetical protein